MNLQQLFADIEATPDADFVQRTTWLDALELALDETHPEYLQIQAVYQRLHAKNELYFEQLRQHIKHSTDATALAKMLWREFSTVSQADTSDQPYDALDVLIHGIFAVQPRGDVGNLLTSEMVAFQPTPARQMLRVLERVQLHSDDVFVDFGSGLGHIPMLVNVLTGVRCVGIEIEPAYCEAAQRCCDQLHRSHVTMRCGDVRMVNWGDGTVFYAYTPFRGEVLHTVMQQVQRHATRRQISIWACGAIRDDFAQQPWLEPLMSFDDPLHPITIFRSLPIAHSANGD